MKNFIMNKKYLWINILLMLFTYGIWIIIFFYLKSKYSKSSKNEDIRSFSMKVSGVTFKNDNGTDRQKLLKNISKDQQLKLVPYKYLDKDAIYVETLNNEILGNIPAKHTINILKKINNNTIIKVSVKEVDKFLNEDNKYIYYLIIQIFEKNK